MVTTDDIMAQMRRDGRIGPRVTRVEIKDWQPGPLTEHRWFVHCSTVTPQDVLQSGGLSPRFAAEVCVDRDKRDIGRANSQFVLAGVIPQDIDPDDPEFTPIVPGFVNVHGYLGKLKDSTYPDGYLYVFQLDPAEPYDGDAQWTYFAANGALVPNSEIGFDRPIPHTCMKVYHRYNKRYQTAELYADWRAPQ